MWEKAFQEILCYAYSIIRFLGLSCFTFQLILLCFLFEFFFFLNKNFSAGMEMSHLVCGGCGTLLMYTRGATSVRCSCCQTINHARAGTFLQTFCKLSDIILCICFQWFHLSVSSYRCIFVMLFIFLQVAVLCEALFGKRIKIFASWKNNLLYSRDELLWRWNGSQVADFLLPKS